MHFQTNFRLIFTKFKCKIVLDNDNTQAFKQRLTIVHCSGPIIQEFDMNINYDFKSRNENVLVYELRQRENALVKKLLSIHKGRI